MASASRVFPKEPSVGQKYIQRKKRLLKRAALCLLATLIILLIGALLPHFGQTTFNYGDMETRLKRRSGSTTPTSAGQTLAPGTNRLFAAQMTGSRTTHPTTGNACTITYAAGGVSFTQTGHFY